MGERAGWVVIWFGAGRVDQGPTVKWLRMSWSLRAKSRIPAFCFLMIVRSTYSLTTVSQALIESICWALWDMEKPLAQLLLVTLWLATKCPWVLFWGVPFLLSCLRGLCPLTLVVANLFCVFSAVISLWFAGTSLPLLHTSPVAPPSGGWALCRHPCPDRPPSPSLQPGYPVLLFPDLTAHPGR